MKGTTRAIIILIALGEASACSWLAIQFAQFGDPMGDAPSTGGRLVSALIVAGIWLLLISPYVCMVAASLKLLRRKSLDAAYVYVLAMLALMTFIELSRFKAVFELMALGNIVGGGLWIRLFRRNTAKKFPNLTHREEIQKHH